MFNQKCFGFLNQYAADSSLLYQKICNLIWYISTHEEKFKLHGSSPPKFFEHLFLFSDPTRSKHAIGKLSKHILLAHIESTTTLLVKSFAYQKSFQHLKVEIDKLIESCEKYSEYLAQNVLQVKESQVNENDPSYVNIVKSLPFFQGDFLKEYNKKETDVNKFILENLDMLDTFEPLNTDNFLPTVHNQQYRFLQSIREKGLPRSKVALFCQEYGTSLGYTYFIWKESVAESKKTKRCSLI